MFPVTVEFKAVPYFSKVISLNLMMNGVCSLDLLKQNRTMRREHDHIQT